MHPSALARPLLLAVLVATGLTAAETPLIDGGAEAFAKTWAGGSVKTMVDGPDGKAIQLVVAVVPDKSWMSQTWISPIKTPVAVGDQLRITLRARCISPAGQKGKVFVAVGQNAAPYNQALGGNIEPEAEWKDFTISGEAKVALSPEQGRFGFSYGFQVQSVEIGKVVVVNLGAK